MINMWLLKENFEYSCRLISYGSGGTAPTITHCDVLNALEVRAADYCGGRFREKPFPIVQLKLTVENFDADYFEWEGRMLVSERMRQVMALDPSAARFFEVDASYSAPVPRTKNYQVMEPTVMEDVSDRATSDFGILPMGEHRAFIEAFSIAMKADAAPAHELFYDSYFRQHLLCTEAFAVRVLKAGCTGMRFVDPGRLAFGENRRYRTLRGIEEHVKRDFDNKIEITQLIQPID